MKQNYEEKLEWQGMPVLTTRMLAERLGVMEVNIRVNLSENKERFLADKDYFVLQGNDLKVFKAGLRKNGLLSYMPGKNAGSLIVWTESGCHNHAKISNTDGAWEAFLWLKDHYFKQREVLKAIKEAFFPENPLFAHTTRPVQVANSKEANRRNFEQGGKTQVVDYHYKSCLMLSGMTPAQLKELGKKHGLKSKQRSSGREVCRTLFPVVAATMSLTDDMCNHGGKLEEIAPLSKSAAPVFAKMIELGMIKKTA